MTQPMDPQRPGSHPDHQPTEQIDNPITDRDPRAYGDTPFSTTPGGPPPFPSGGPGEPPMPPGPPAPPSGKGSWFSGSRRVGIVAGVAGLVIGGVIGGSIGWAATGDSSTATTNTAQTAPAQVQTHKRAQDGAGAAAGQRHRAGTVGTITAENGTSWTVAARDGRSVTVQIGADTTFGTAKKPQQQSDFAVGDRIVVVGKDNSGTVEATRVAKRATPAAGAATPGATTPGATTQPS